MTDLWQLDATDLARLIRTGQVSAREATESHLYRLEQVNPKINAVVRVLDEEARAEADRADAALRGGEIVGPLHGVPVTTKISADQKGCPTDIGVIMLKDLIAQEDSPQISNLRRAGAIIIGRTNSPAFAMRAMTDNLLHGLTLNPWNRDYTCGGSSGGAAAGIAVGIGAVAQGGDIGGSIRWPAYCNGIVGLRPSVGRVPSYNATATTPRSFAFQLMGVQGPLARSVRDVRLALKVMAAGDSRDHVWVPAPLDGPPLRHPIRVALVTERPGGSIHPAAIAAVRKSGQYLAAAGYQVEELLPPEIDRVAELWHPIGLPELAARFKPIFKKIGDAAFECYLSNWIDQKGGADLPSFPAALVERGTMLTRWQAFLDRYPIIVMPSCTEVALPTNLDAQGSEGVARTVEAMFFQLVAPVLGLPGLAVPVGQQDGLPMGVQIVSRRFREDLCFDAGEIIEAHEGPHRPIDPKF